MKIKVLLVLTLALGTAAVAVAQTGVTFIPAGAVWRYLDDRSDQGTAWRAVNYNDSAWRSGPAQLGYGDGDEATVINGGPGNNRIATTYFRRAFTLGSTQSFSAVLVRLVRDDGGIVYLNGVEVFRSSMPAGPVNYLTFASSRADGGAESQFFSNTVGTADLIVGTNVIAVEIHQIDAGSSDVSFNFELVGLTATATMPTIAAQPANAAVVPGNSVTFTVRAGGNGPFAYYWRKNSASLPGGGHILGVNTPNLTITGADATDAGAYSVVISNSAGFVTSADATLTVLPQPTTIFDDFDPGTELSQWAAFGGLARATNFGGSSSPPNALAFAGDGDRFATTRAIDTTAGGFISFALRLSAGGLGNNWENLDIPAEGVVFEYSINGGSNWTRIATYDTPEFTVWSLQEMFIPAGALSTRTQFRWRQLENSGDCCDHWAIDDIAIESVPFPPIIVQEPADRAALEGGSATFAVEVAGTPVLHYQWSFNGQGIPNATNATYTVHGAASNHAGLYRVSIDNALGLAQSREARLSVIDGSRDTFRIAALTTNNARIVEHFALSGDDRGGIAASASRLFYSGDSATACFDLADLGNATNVAVVHDAILSDLRSGAVYVLGTAQGPMTALGGTATRLLEIDGHTGLPTANSIPLTQPIPLSGNFPNYGNIGFFSGYGRAAVHNATNVFTILLPFGEVIDLGPLPPLTRNAPGTWAYWGVMELFDGATWLTRVQDFRTVVRTRAGDGLTRTVATFRSLANMSTFTAVPASNRWYFHHSFGSEFGSGDELAGFADAVFSFTQDTQAVSIVEGPRGRTVVAGQSVEFQVSALGFPLRYQWLRDGAPLPNENGFRLHLSNVTTNDAATYSVIVSNDLGFVTSAGAVLRVALPATVAVFDDQNYVDTFGGPYSGSDSVQASLLSLGHQVLPFATSNIVATLGAGRPVLFPALNYRNPARDFPVATRQALQNFVVNGGLLVIHGAYYPGAFLNDVFGLSLAVQFGGGPFPRTPDAAGTAFADTPSSIPANSSTYTLLPQSLSLGARHAYGTSNTTAVASIPIGSGRIVWLGYDWSNARPLGSQDGGWLEVLGAALQENTPPPSGLPSIAVQPRSRPGVVGVDVPLNVVAFGQGPISFQWYFNGGAIPSARSSSYTIALPTTASSGDYFVVVSNSFGTTTSQVAQVTVRPSRGQAGYYTDNDPEADGPELSILQAAFTPVRIENISSANLAPLRLLLINEAGFNSITTPLRARLPDIATWVQNGGRLIVHDLNDGPSDLLVGATRTPMHIAGTSTLDVVPPGNTLVTAGPHGTLTNGSLASEFNFISYTAVSAEDLPSGATPILGHGIGATQTVAFGYGIGSGAVYYSTILLASYLEVALAETELLSSVYVPNVIEFVHAFTPSGPPVIVAPPYDTAALPNGRALLSVFAGGQPALRYQWRFNNTLLAGATNSSLVITGVNASHVGSYSVEVSNPLGTTNSPPASLTILDARPFRLASLGTAGSQIIDHDPVTSDDRGGIAVSSNSVFYTGDSGTGRFSAANLNGGTPLGVYYDSLIGNLRNETVYSLANGTNLISNGGGVVDTLIEIDGTTGARTTNIIRLSAPIPLQGGYGSAGIFSGYDAAVLHDGARAWRLDFQSGFVTDLGFMAPPQHQSCENWAYWGVAEFFNGAMWLVAVRDQTTITRTRVPDGFATNVATFTSLGDMCSFTVSLSRDRWYFHYENSAQFGGQFETLGFASATWDRPPTIAAIGDSTVNEDAPPFTIFLNLADDFTAVASLGVSASSSDTNLLSVALGTAGGLRTLTATAAPDRYGTSLVSLIVTDSIGNTVNRGFTFTVNPVNDPPSFTPGTNITVLEDAGTFLLPSWATQISAGPHEAGQAVSFIASNDNPALFAQPPAVSALGELSFAPAPHAHGSATVTLRLQDNGGTANGGVNIGGPRTFTVTVLPVNDPPTSVAQSVTTPEDTAIPITLTGADLDGDALGFVIVTPPAHGSLSGSSPNFSYLPATNYHGPDSFTFKANDRQAESPPATVQITVTAINDPPLAAPQSLTTDEDTSLSINLAGSDADGQPLTFAIVSPPTNGILTGTAPNLIYVPATNYAGPDHFTFQASDGQSDSTAVVELAVRPVNDAPSADGKSLTLAEDSSIGIALSGSDLEGDALTFFVVTPPAHGTLSGTGSNLVYVPVLNYAGPDSFTFKVNDGQADSSPAVVTLAITPVNDPPTAQSLAVATDEGTAIKFNLVGTDPDGDKLKFLIRTMPAHGQLTVQRGATYRYTPEPGFDGTDTFTYAVSDGTAISGEATVTITVRSVNNAPVASARVLNLIYLTPGSAHGVVLSPNNTNASVVLDASLSSDPDGDSLQFLWLRDGEVVPFAGGVTVTNFFPVGSHTVVLLADDGLVVGTATITVEVITAADAIGELISYVNSSNLPAQRIRPLLASLEAAAASYARGNMNSAANQLGAFQHKLRAQIASSHPALAAALDSAAQSIVNAMGP